MQFFTWTLFAAIASTTAAFQHESHGSDGIYLARRAVNYLDELDTIYARDLDESILESLTVRDLIENYIEARNEKDAKKREKWEKEQKKKSDKLRDQYLDRAYKTEGRRTLNAGEIAEIQRLLGGKDNGGWPQASR